MQILTWNINGIRASRVSLKELFYYLDADVICLQETKVTRDQLDELSAIVDGYNAYFSFSKARSGYSGVATFVRDGVTPVKAEEGLTGILSVNQHLGDNIGCYGDHTDFTDEELQSLDSEGRTVITQHSMMTSSEEEKQLTIINVYCPRADPEKEERKNFKVRFYQLLQKRSEALLRSGSHVIVLGDVNTSHKKIDHCDPSEDVEFLANPGRQWLSQFLWNPLTEPQSSNPAVSSVDSLNSPSKTPHQASGMFVDTFRYFHPNQEGAFTCWSTVTGARATNYGTRIDYILADIKLTRDRFHNCVIMPDVQGSDHCPVKATLNLKVVAAKKCPPLCTKWLPEFSGKQQKLSAFFTKSSTVTNSMNSSSKQFQSGQKRTGSVSPKGPMVKRQKTGGSQKPSIQKQGSLLTFFNRSEKSNPDSGAASDRQNETTVEMDFNSGAHLNSSQCQNSSSCSKKLNIKHLSRSETNSKAASSWKTLLKGPPQAPNCKGHKEPCVLRTVKKDGPNKGRQFWVCNRPEGHKSNPEARCEHFVWIKK